MMHFLSSARRYVVSHATPTAIVLWLALAGVVSYLTYASVQAYQLAMLQLTERSVAYSRMVADHDSFVIDRAKLLLLEIEDVLTWNDLNGKASEPRRALIDEHIYRHRNRLPGISSITIVGADGIRRFGNVGRDFVDLSDRKFFVALRDGAPDIYIGAAEPDHATGIVGIYVAKTVKVGGQFAGVVAFNLSIEDLFYPYYASLDLGRTAFVTLRNRTTLLSRFPGAGSTPGQTFPTGSAVTDLIAKGHHRGVVRTKSPIDEIDRVAAFDQTDGSDLFTVVGLSVDEALLPVRQSILAAIIASLAAIVAGGIATVGLRRLTQRRDELQDIAQTDVLTGLHNRQYLVDRFDDIATSAKAAGCHLGVIFIDLDNFKLVNDSLGHSVGDQLLMQVADRFKTTVGVNDLVTRLGGDEFIIIHDAGSNDPTPSTESICWNLLQAIREPFIVGAHTIATGASIGAAIYPYHGDTIDELSRKADIAMYRGKAFGRGVYTVYYPGLEDGHARDTLALQSGLVEAIERKEFQIYFGPIINVADGRTCAAEVLVRWRKDDGAVIPAGKFIGLAEKTGLIIPLGKWILEETCQFAARWLSLKLPPMVFSVNVSAVQFNQDDIEQTVIGLLNEYRIPPSMLQIEISETVMLADNELIEGRISRLNSLGVSFAVDDFGTGYSSLSYLSKYAISKIKIDPSFGERATHNKKSMSLLTAIIDMSHAMELRTIAEGVESHESFELYRRLGCDEVQGYLFSRPLSGEGLIEFVREFAMAQG